MVALFAQQSNIIDFPTQQKSNEWFTPVRYIEAARQVMGGIDLDPASCFEANQTVRAKHYYTAGDDGLLMPWFGNIWLNPPYALDRKANGLYKSSIEVFSTKLVDEYKQGHIKQAVLLVMACINSQWFRVMWDYPICFADHIVKFIGGKTNPKTPLMHRQGTCFVYLGPNNERFAEVFSEFGPVIPANVAIRRQKVTPLSLWEVHP